MSNVLIICGICYIISEFFYLFLFSNCTLLVLYNVSVHHCPPILSKPQLSQPVVLGRRGRRVEGEWEERGGGWRGRGRGGEWSRNGIIKYSECHREGKQ